MTPWGIRGKLKSALGRPSGPAKADDTLSLTIVLPTGAEHPVRCEARYTLVMASQTLETPIATGCPDGHCGTCTVEVIEGAGLTTPTSAEQKLLTEQGRASNIRLACHAKVIGSGAKVKVHQVWTMDSVKGEGVRS